MGENGNGFVKSGKVDKKTEQEKSCKVDKKRKETNESTKNRVVEKVCNEIDNGVSKAGGKQKCSVKTDL